MMEQCKAQHTPEPEFVLIRNKEFRTILPRDYLTDQVLTRIGLNERQRKAVDFIKVSKKITNKDLRQLTDAIYRTDLPPKKWTQRRVGGSITTGSKTGGVLWMGRGVNLSGLTGI